MIRTMYIDGKEIHTTWGLWLQAKTIPLPAPRTRFVEIEGGNGSIDLSTALTNGKMRYDDREAEFVVTCFDRSYIEVRNELAAQVHGRRVRIELSDEPSYYYMGRIWVSEWHYEKGDISVFTLEARLDPFRYSDERTEAVEVSRTSSGTEDVTLKNEGVTPSAVIVNVDIPDGGQIDMMWPYPSGILYRLFPGENDISLILEAEEEITTRLQFSSGGGTVTFEYEERSL